jgi:superfamily II DNA or RNA helicase
MVEITEKMLAAAATWPVVHEAKKLHSGGRVLRAAYDPPVLRGVVREGSRTYAAALKIHSASHMENLCSCKLARTQSKICAHAVAVAMEVLHGPPGQTAAMPKANKNTAPRATAGPVVTIEGSLEGVEALVVSDSETTKNEAASRLMSAGFVQSRGRLTLTGRDAVLRFLAEHWADLSKNWHITFGERFAGHFQSVDRVALRGKLLQGPESGWLRLHCEAEVDGVEVPWQELQRAVASGAPAIALANGKLALLDRRIWKDLDETLRDSDVRTDGRQNWLVPQRYADFVRASLSEWNAEEPPAMPQKQISLGKLGNVLRTYQAEGVYWLADRAESVGGAILADDMGLGKTVQAISVLQHLRGPALVVCPASLVFNWCAEVQKFWPEARVLAWAGPERGSKRSLLASMDLVVTNYALLRSDAAELSAMTWSAVILDEAQHIKNPQSRNAETAKRLPAGFRLALTGTPLENSLNDLWSLGDFVAPGYLDTAAHFRETYVKPIVQSNDRDTMRRLKRKLRPLILRRTKSEVLGELPPKMEINSFCEMGEEQRSLYAQIQRDGWLNVEAHDPKKQSQARRMAILTLLLRLRQVCCDPALLPDFEPGRVPSAKVELFRELLAASIDAGRRTLVFSQFSRMLRKLESMAENWGLQSCYLDGATNDRQSVVDRFKRQINIPVFFISLKAGGVGLNLTEADHVIHFDPWWNPAAEDQATDRVHRIGQKKSVLSQRLIVANSVEEKVIQLQDFKKAQILDFLGSEGETDGAQAANGMTDQELESLVRPESAL